MSDIRNYIDFKQEIWDILSEEIKNGKLHSMISKELRLYWGRRELNEIFDAALPELQLISSTIHTPSALNDQEDFVFPQTNALTFRLIDRSSIDAKEAERQTLDLASRIIEILRSQGTMDGRITSPVVSRVDFQDMNDGKSFYYGADIGFEAKLTI